MATSIHARADVENVSAGLVQLIVSEIETGRSFGVAILTALVYHSITTIDMEVKYFWLNPCNPVSLIYFANRYIGLLAATFSVVLQGFEDNILVCKFSNWTLSLADFITIVLIDYILLIRVSALYHQSKMLDICLKILLLLETVADLGLFIYANLVDEITVFSLAEGLAICALAKATPELLIIISWSIPLAYGLLLLILALYKATEFWRLSHGFQGFYLVRVLVEDQLIYYGFVIVCCVLRIVSRRIETMSPFAANVVGSVSSPTLLCILGSQLLFNLKEAGERGTNPGTSFRIKTLSGIRFS